MSVYRRSIATLAVLASHSAFAQETQPEEIIVTSSALRETALEVAQPAAVLGGDALRRQIASSLGETIASELGVSATYFGPTSSRPVIRGLGGERVLMLHDGVSALDVSSLSQDHAVAVEAVLADQVEILRGPATLLFGSGAVGGVINVVDGRIPTRFTESANRRSVEIRGDTASDERTAVGRIDLGSDAVRIHVDGFKRETQDVNIPGYAFSAAERAEHLEEHPDETFRHGTLENSDSETYGGAFGISTGSESGFVGLSVGRYDTNYGVPIAHEHGAEDQEHDEADHDHDHDLRIDMRQTRYDLKAERVLRSGPWERLRLRASYNDYEHRELEGGAVGTVFEQTGLDVRGNLDHADIGGWRGTLGVQYLETDLDARGVEAFVPPSLTRQLALFVFEQREFGAITLELGARAENQRIDPQGAMRDYDETAYSVSGGIIWNFSEAYSVAANLTRSQRHPQGVELYANGPHLAISRFEIGQDSLGTETANTIDLTLHRHHEHGIHWSLSAFYNDFADYIYASPTGDEEDGLPVYRYAQAEAEYYGFEGEITFPVYEAGETHFEVRIASDYVRGRLKDGGNLPQIPPLRFGVELHYERGPFHLGLEAYRHDRQKDVAAGERETAGYTMFDADVSYRAELGSRELLFFLKGSNLLDEDARRHASPLKEIAPLPGRSLHAGIRAEF